MKIDDALRANQLVIEVLGSLFPGAALENLGNDAVRAIRLELDKAGLGSTENMEEVLQSALLSTYRHFLPGGKVVRSPRGYFLKVCVHEADRFMKPVIAAERARQLASEWLQVLHGQRELPADPLENERVSVLEALARIPAMHSRLLRLLWISELSKEEIKAELRISEGAYRTRKSRAVAVLRAALRGLAAKKAAGAGRNRQTPGQEKEVRDQKTH